MFRGSGGDRPIECGAACVTGTDYGERVVLTATPDADSVFTGWIGDCAPASGTSCTVHMVYGSITYYAVFDRAGHPPTPLQEPSSHSPRHRRHPHSRSNRRAGRPAAARSSARRETTSSPERRRATSSADLRGTITSTGAEARRCFAEARDTTS